MSLKNKLKDLRHDFRMNQIQFSDFLDVDNNLYNRWENNKIQPSLEWAMKIAAKTERPIESFIYLDQES